MMLEAYVPILILLVVSILNAVGMVVLSHMVSPLRPTAVKSAPYESGVLPLGGTRERFSVKFYMVAILFIVFDLETVLLIPWAVAMRTLGWNGFIAVLIFLVVLTVGLIYEWKKGALQWD
jgi:NADH-quinone oxidoreductase subunit A